MGNMVYLYFIIKKEINHKPLDRGQSANGGSPFLVMLVPVLVSRSVQVESFKGSKELVSTSFIARFQDGTEKVINRKTWQQAGLLRQSDIGDVVLTHDECTLYYKDWSKNPVFGKWDKNYPTNIIPEEILELT